MGAVPKKKHTTARRGRRRNAITKRLVLPNLSKCSSCGKMRRSHETCPHCGHYKS